MIKKNVDNENNDVSTDNENNDVSTDNENNDVSVDNENNDVSVDNENNINNKNNIYIDTIVLSGGGIKGFNMLGSMEYLYDEYYIHHDKIKNMIGTSIGSIICYLLVIGYKPLEIVSYICCNQIMENLNDINVLKILKSEETIKFSVIQDALEG